MQSTTNEPPGQATLPADLDLTLTIRPGLDILANEIVIALRKRTRFPVNAAVYEPGLVVGDDQCSLLDRTLAGVEQLHAELGRYTFAAQDAFSDVTAVRPIIQRDLPTNAVRAMPGRVGPRVLMFYRDWLDRACRAGDDPSTYGETVTADVGALLSILERVNLGKSVAESKFRELEAQFRATGGDRDAMLSLIVRRDREASVLAMADSLAQRYELAVDDCRAVFDFMIATTIDVELDYLRERMAD